MPEKEKSSKDLKTLLSNMKALDLDELHLQAILLSKVIRRVLKSKANLDLSRDPQMTKLAIVEFKKHMRVSSLEKFDATTYISAINFYVNEKDKADGKTLGSLIIYVTEEYVPYLLKKLGYPDIEDEDEQVLEDACGAFCNIIAAKFKSGLTQLGYIEPVMSHFMSYRNQAPGGLEFDRRQKELYEITFDIKDEKRLIVDLTMGSVPMA